MESKSKNDKRQGRWSGQVRKEDLKMKGKRSYYLPIGNVVETIGF